MWHPDGNGPFAIFQPSRLGSKLRFERNPNMTKRTEVFKKLTRASRLIPLASVALALSFALSEANAQPPRAGDVKQFEGRVQSRTTAPMGEVDGAVLDDGTVIHWPPHLAGRFTAIAVTGDRIRAAGRIETGPGGDTHLEVQTVTNLRTSASAENEVGPPPPPPGPGRLVSPPPRGPRVRPGAFDSRIGPEKTAQGRIGNMTTAPMGEVDGAVLDDSSVIHWPPHLADRFTAVVTRGDRVKVSGWMETGPAGDTHLEVQTATNFRTNATASNDIGPPAARPAPDGAGDFAPAPATNDQVERRLKALEDQIAQLREEIQRLRNEL